MCKKIMAILLTVLLTFGVVAITTPTSAHAATCYGVGCNGLDPAGRCDHDARTVAVMQVTDGLLELRWSPSYL